jgi:hypothetical protein
VHVSRTPLRPTLKAKTALVPGTADLSAQPCFFKITTHKVIPIFMPIVSQYDDGLGGRDVFTLLSPTLHDDCGEN